MQGTFRDPSGSLFDIEGRILRVVNSSEVAPFESLLKTDVVEGLVQRGALVRTRRADSAELPDSLRSFDGAWFEHDRVGFVSVPAEWSAAMLAQAALHTLDVNDTLLRSGWVLKDATPANILFEGARAVLVDVPSIEPLKPGRGLWNALHQFETTFLLPLMATLMPDARSSGPSAILRVGSSHEQLAALLGPRRWWGADRIRHIALPAALGKIQPASGSTGGRDRVATNPTSGNLEKPVTSSVAPWPGCDGPSRSLSAASNAGSRTGVAMRRAVRTTPRRTSTRNEVLSEKSAASAGRLGPRRRCQHRRVQRDGVDSRKCRRR